MTHDHSGEICKGILAVCINAIAVITSTMENLEYWLRITSLGIGIVVGALTIISIVRKHFR
jgi:uncharacterized membrane protein